MGEQTQRTAGSSEDEDGLRELAIRLLTFHFGYLASDQQREPQLLVGALPPDLPVELPIPDGGRLLGSFTLNEPLIALDAPLSDEEVIAFYRERLTAAGWEEAEHFGPMHGGFVHSMQTERAIAHFFASEDRYTLRVMARSLSDDRATIQLTLTDGAPMRAHQVRRGRDFNDVFPPIRPPRNAAQHPRGGSSGPDAVDTSASLETELDLDVVSRHYVSELQRGGWRSVESGIAGPAAWSAWSFTDQDGATWQAWLLILRHPNRPSHYALWLQAEREGGVGQSSSGRVVTASGGSAYGRLLGWQAHTVISQPQPEPPTKPETPE